MLGIDTSGKTASAALYDTENRIFLAQNTLYTRKTHSQVIMPICRDIIAQTGNKIEDIQAIAVANGPGSYTGLRIGAAAVKAMSFALDCPCCGVSTLEGMAYNNLQFYGIICSVMKARGELIYACAYKSDGTAPEQLCEERLIDKAEFSEYLDSFGENILLCGDGAGRVFERLSVSYQEVLLRLLRFFKMLPESVLLRLKKSFTNRKNWRFHTCKKSRRKRT